MRSSFYFLKLNEALSLERDFDSIMSRQVDAAAVVVATKPTHKQRMLEKLLLEASSFPPDRKAMQIEHKQQQSANL